MSKVVLITGFLGSGKTTLLSRVLENYSQRMRIAVIQNEYADASCDSVQLKMSRWNFELVELNKGSIFCICLYSDFREELVRLVVEKSPDLILIEASGLSDPISVGSLLNDSSHFYLCHILTIVEPSLFLKMSGYVKSINNQVRVADSVIINKCDREDSVQIEGVKERIKLLNPNAAVACARFAELQESSPFNFDHIFLNQNEDQTLSRVVNERFPVNVASPGTRPDNIHSHVFRTTKRVDKETLLRFCSTIPESVIRVKGFVMCSDGSDYMIQYVDGDKIATLTPIDTITKTEVIFIGTDINAFVNLVIDR
jgi:G3E family GTPase